MKRIIFLIVVSLSFTFSKAQSYNAVYVSHQPVDLGIGMRGDYYIKRMGLYSSLSYGNWGFYKREDIKHHVKFTTGVLVPLPDYNGGIFDITAGINYHLFGSIPIESPLNPHIFNPWSFELGLTTKLRYFAVAIRIDILRWEPCVDIGFTFGGK